MSTKRFLLLVLAGALSAVAAEIIKRELFKNETK